MIRKLLGCKIRVKARKIPSFYCLGVSCKEYDSFLHLLIHRVSLISKSLDL